MDTSRREPEWRKAGKYALERGSWRISAARHREGHNYTLWSKATGEWREVATAGDAETLKELVGATRSPD